MSNFTWRDIKPWMWGVIILICVVAILLALWGTDVIKMEKMSTDPEPEYDIENYTET